MRSNQLGFVVQLVWVAYRQLYETTKLGSIEWKTILVLSSSYCETTRLVVS